MDAARTIARVIETPKPRARYLIGRDAKIMSRVARLLRDRALDRLIAWNLGLGEPEANAQPRSLSSVPAARERLHPI
jgi:hypothetical protein